ncbi:hypothetical protein B0H16DRAFT_1842025 [Mycena metata]|uniref:F-box domain-containing protein n=1 Tax=Mycena metata TaxID=1033252 RepID=A0AAD7IVW0_9AGAR|nr:hypothetical protein B0H16DRAFT_1842025 [Mycena metata]
MAALSDAPSDASSLQLEPLEPLLITQNPPLASEVAMARAIAAKAQDDLKNVKARIAELRVQERRLQHHFDDHQRIVFSINRLPIELLSLIFRFALPSVRQLLKDKLYYPTTRPAAPAIAQSPWLVSQVCKLWREIALTSHSLWAFPIVFPPTQSPSQLKLHLERAGNAGLHPLLSGSPDVRYFPRLLASVVEYSPRWVTLWMSFNWTPFQDELVALKGHVGQLEELRIDGVWGDDEDTALEEGERLTVFAVAPRLRTVEINDVCEPAVSILLPWHQLTEYRGIGTAHEHLSVLKHCANLVTLHLTFTSAVTVVLTAVVPTEPAQYELVLPHLVRLHIGDAEFLRVMSLPVLQHIVVQRKDWDPDYDTLLPLLHLVQRTDRPSTASPFPTISALRIHVQRGDTTAIDELLGRLTLTPDNGQPTSTAACLAPSLISIELVGRGTYNEARFVEMVESRWRGCGGGCAQIRRVVLFRTMSTPEFMSDTMQRLGALAKEGLYVSVTASPKPVLDFYDRHDEWTRLLN